VGWERSVAAGIFQEGSVEMDKEKLVEHAVIELASAMKDVPRGLLTA
jgi:hypothetical protein